MVLEVRYRKIQNCYYKSILFVKVFGYTKLLLMTIWRSLGCCISVGLDSVGFVRGRRTAARCGFEDGVDDHLGGLFPCPHLVKLWRGFVGC